MKEITKVIKVCRFDELSEKAREKACQQVGDSMTDNSWWYKDTLGLFVEQCASYGMTIDEADIEFSGFGSQGDGASFVCATIDIEKLLHTLDIQVSDELKKVLNYIVVNISRSTWKAFHEQTVHTEIFIAEDASTEEEEGIKRYSREITDIEFKIEKLKDDLCQKVYYELEREYNYFHSEEYVDELAYYNKMLFLEDGTIYDWGE